MPDLICFDPCAPNVPEELPDNNFQAECNCNGGGGGSFTLFTGDSGTVALSGAGTSGDPLIAEFVPGQIIAFEMAFGAQNGLTDGQEVGIYVPTKPITIPANLPNLGIAIEDQVSEVNLEITKGDVVVGTIAIVGGSATVSFPSNVQLAANEKLEIVSTSLSEFSVLGITIRALRELEFLP